MAYQLPNCSHFIVNLPQILIEPENEPDQSGVSSLLITTLDVQTMPLLRYRIGDLGKFSPEWDPGQPVKTLEEVIGRDLDLIYLPGDRLLHSVVFPHSFKDFDLLAYQVIQAENGAVEINLVPGKHFDESSLARIHCILEQNLAGVEITIKLGDSIQRTPNAKLRPVISHFRPLSTDK